jgi:hypothetical protein
LREAPQLRDHYHWPSSPSFAGAINGLIGRFDCVGEENLTGDDYAHTLTVAVRSVDRK